MFELTEKDVNRLWSKIPKRRWNQCWPWAAKSSLPSGYGLLTLKSGKQIVASRLVCFLAHGSAPEGKPFALHSCDNPACCNPRHLRWGSSRDNARDAIERGRNSPPPRNVSWMVRFPDRVRRGADAARAKLNDELVLQLMQKRAAGASLSVLAAEFGIDKSVVADISKGQCWRHVLSMPGAPTVEQMQAVRNFRSGAKITPEMASDIKQRLKAGETGRSIAKRFGLHFASVSDIKRGLTWRDA
jgi:hypothetical protein